MNTAIQPRKIELIISSVFGSTKNMIDSLEISQSAISKIKHGKQDIPTRVVKTLISKYRVDPDWLFGTDPEEPIRYMGESGHDSKYYELLQKHTALQEELAAYQREKIRKLEKS